jgi:rhamnosyl/mannosyltransferase
LREKLQIIPFGISDFSKVLPIDLTIFSRFRFDATQPFFLFLGALRYYKGLDYLLEAAKNVAAQIVIAGEDLQNGYLQRKAAKLGLDNVIFTGSINQIEKQALLHQCFAFVFPSHLRSEAFGMTLVEAAMFGKPLISCEIETGTSFINLDNVTGLVVSPADSTALGNAMNHLFYNKKVAAGFGKAARLRYETMFNGQAMGEAYSRFFRVGSQK